MLHRQRIQERLPTRTHLNPNLHTQSHPTLRYTETTQLLPFMQEMLESAVLKMKTNNNQQNKQLIAQSIHLINKTLINMYKLNHNEVRPLLKHFLQELSNRFFNQKQDREQDTSNCSTQLLPFMQEMLESAALKMKTNNNQQNKQLIAQSIYLINKTLVNRYRLNNTEMRPLIKHFLQELSTRYLEQSTETSVPLLLPFMQSMLDNAVLKMKTNNNQQNKQLIAQSIFLINKTLVNRYRLNNTEMRSLIKHFIQELSTNFLNQNQGINGCVQEHHHHNEYIYIHDIDNHEHHHNHCDHDDSDPCLPPQKTTNSGFFNSLTITIPTDLCEFLR